MPNIKSAHKALRQSQKRRTRNLAGKKAIKDTIKDFKKVLAQDSKAASGNLSGVYKKLDKAAKTNLIKKNKAARLKSRLAKKLTAVAK